MEIFVIGLNYKTASVENLERAYISNDELPNSLKAMKNSGGLEEVVLLSTCNRVEAYGVTYNGKQSKASLTTFLQQKSGIHENRLTKLLYEYSDAEAVRHLFQVASGVDSMVMGEPEILGQVKTAYKNSVSEDCSGKILNYIFPKAFKIAKRVRSETGISKNAVSIASVCTQLTAKIFDDLSKSSALLIGAGEIAEQIGTHIAKFNPKIIYILNRTLDRANLLAQRLDAVSITDVDQVLAQVDIVVTSTSSPKYLLTKDQVAQAMKTRGGRPLFLIDVSVPRDIDPETQEIRNVYLYNIDDLGNIAHENLNKRKQEAKQAIELIDNELSAFSSWLNRLEIEPVIANLKAKIENLCQYEISRCFRKNKSFRLEREAAQALAKSLSKKILHDPITVLKESADLQEGSYARVVRRLFRLR